MLSSPPCMDGWLLRTHTLALIPAAPLPAVQCTEIFNWRREFIIMAIVRLSAVRPRHGTCDSGKWNRETRRMTISGSFSGSNLTRHLLQYNCISPMAIIQPDILHTINLGMVQDWMDCVMASLDGHSRIEQFDHFWAMMSPYHFFTRFNKPYNQVMRWSGRGIKSLGRPIVQVFMPTLSNPLESQKIPFTDVSLCIKNIVYFHITTQYQ